MKVGLSLGVTGKTGLGGVTLLAPVLTWDGVSSDASPNFTIALDALAAVGDVVTLQYSTGNDFASVTTLTDTLDAGEVAGLTVSISTSNLSDGTYYFRAKHSRAGSSSAWSNTATVTVDTTAPTLSSPGSSAVTATTATISVTTNDATGTLYYVVTTSSTPPSATQVKAGNNDGGTAAAKSGSQAIASTGAKTADLTSLTSSTAYYGYWMHEDANGNQSSVSATGLFTTSSSYTQATKTINGSTYITYTSDASVPDTPVSGTAGLTFSAWIDMGAVNGTTRALYNHASRILVFRNATNQIGWTIRNSANVIIAAGNDNATLVDADGLVHYSFAFNGVAGTVQVYRNNVAATVTNTTLTTGSPHWSRSAQASAIFTNPGPSNNFNGIVGDLWIMPKYLDLSTNNSSFYNGGTPPDLTGFQSPIIWLGGSMSTAQWNSGTNLGTFTPTLTVTGAFT